ncbi:hypothetical protein U3516DRAFT_735005 [Neocallimastix sp. 'constans']
MNYSNQTNINLNINDTPIIEDYATDHNITLDIKENDFNINYISLINRVNSEIMLKIQSIILINQNYIRNKINTLKILYISYFEHQPILERKYLNINTSLFQILLPKINRFYNFYSNYEIRGNNYRQNIFNNYLNDYNSNIKNKLNLIFNANSTENESDFDSNPNKYNSISYNYRFIKRRLIEIPFNYLYQEYSEYQVNNSTSYKNGTHKAINDLTSKILNIKYIRITT